MGNREFNELGDCFVASLLATRLCSISGTCSISQRVVPKVFYRLLEYGSDLM